MRIGASRAVRRRCDAYVRVVLNAEFRMDLDLEQLAALALRLPAPDRAEVAARLLASLEQDEVEQRAYEQGWAEELDRRDAVAAEQPLGTATTADVVAELRADLAERRVRRS